MTPRLPPESDWLPLLRRSLDEDLGGGVDITTDSVVPATASAMGRLTVREDGVVAGLPVALRVFALLDPAVETESAVSDGDTVSAGEVIAIVSGPARPILTGERTALNLLCHLSGVATGTAVAVAVAGSGSRVAATRKTIPGLRLLEKYAVECGGGWGHRSGLHDAVLIKDNHLAVAGSIAEAVARARTALGPDVAIEIEVDTLRGLDAAAEAGADVVLLDNMTPEQVAEAVSRRPAGIRLEASGGITPETLAAYAATGVDVVSMGWLTHSARSLDVALDFAIDP